jgi:hypothetical protein
MISPGFGARALCAAFLLTGCATQSQQSPAAASSSSTNVPSSERKIQTPELPKHFTLTAEDYWRLELPNGRPFDASGLLLQPDGSLLTVNDREPGLHRIVFNKDAASATNHTARLEPANIFTSAQLQSFNAERSSRWDLEGLARDDDGRIYVCEEANRWIMRFDPATQSVERLDINWTPVRQYFHPINNNASFEGIAISGDKLWVANERDRARVIEVDLKTLKVTGDFAVTSTTPALVLHYSDLSFRDGHLFILLRHHRVILEVEPATRQVLAEYNYGAMEESPEHQYFKEYPTGAMEGLAIDDKYFWLVTDNNSLARRQAPNDRRPTLFKCARPR